MKSKYILRVTLVIILMLQLLGWYLFRWPGVRYAEVRAYAWADDAAPYCCVYHNLRPAGGALVPEGVKLNEDQVRRLLKAEANLKVSHPIAGCYSPHNAFVFFDRNQQPVAMIELCFDCLNYRISPPDSLSEPNYFHMALLFEELKLPFGNHKTASELAGRAF